MRRIAHLLLATALLSVLAIGAVSPSPAALPVRGPRWVMAALSAIVGQEVEMLEYGDPDRPIFDGETIPRCPAYMVAEDYINASIAGLYDITTFVVFWRDATYDPDFNFEYSTFVWDSQDVPANEPETRNYYAHFWVASKARYSFLAVVVPHGGDAGDFRDAVAQMNANGTHEARIGEALYTRFDFNVKGSGCKNRPGELGP